MDKGPHNKAESSETNRIESMEFSHLIGAGRLLNRILIEPDPRPTISKWKLLKLKSFYTAKDAFISANQKSTHSGKYLYQLHIWQRVNT